jgi:hypothetical protein
MDFMSKPLALADPVPLTVPILITTSLILDTNALPQRKAATDSATNLA